MTPAVTRRGLVRAGAAALGAAAAGIPASTQAEAGIPVSDPDAELYALLDRYDAALAAWEATGAPVDEAMARAVAAYPPLPEALRWRPGDMPRTTMGRGLSDPEGDDGGRVYGARAAAWLRDRPAATWFRSLTPPLGPECETRRLEILAAWDAHVADRERINDGVGFTAAAEAEDRAQIAWDAAGDAMRVYRPRGVLGLATKAAWVAMRLRQGCDDLGEAFAREVAAFGGVAG